eukprot:15332187-Ditylum_brightwellii.AAC.1
MQKAQQWNPNDGHGITVGISCQRQRQRQRQRKMWGDGDPEEEIVSPAGGSKVRPFICCNKCNKKCHYANKCPGLLKNKEDKMSVFIIDKEDDPKDEDSDGKNEFIFLPTWHKTVNKNMLLLDNQSSTNIMCDRKYVTNIRRVNWMLTLN